MTVDVIDHIAPLAERHDAFLFDLWGVVHNGIEAYPGALRTMAALKERNRRVILLSNAPRLGSFVEPFLEKMGVDRAHYDRVVASGDLVRQALEGDLHVGRRFLYWGKGPDRTMTQGLDLQESDSVEDAEFILCGGLNNDETETVADYGEVLARAKERGLPLVCANPDYEVMRGAQMLPCAGALAQAYEAIGGKVHWFGKPYPVAYEYCRQHLGDIPTDAVLAVGDTLRTDIAGATAAGIKGVLVTGGIHAREVMPGGDLDRAALERICAEADLWPVAAMTQLDW